LEVLELFRQKGELPQDLDARAVTRRGIFSTTQKERDTEFAVRRGTRPKEEIPHIKPRMKTHKLKGCTRETREEKEGTDVSLCEHLGASREEKREGRVVPLDFRPEAHGTREGIWFWR